MFLRRVAKALEALNVADRLAAPLYVFDPFETRFEDVEPAHYYTADSVERTPPPNGRLRVMTWNIKYGGGRIDFWYEGHGDRVIMKPREVRRHLRGIAEKLRHTDPDVLLLQEVDIDSRRSGYIDQMQWLLDHTHLQFGVYAPQWRSKMVPAKNLGRIDTGNAVLSKYPVGDAIRQALPQMSTQDAITRYFYLNRGLLSAAVRIPQFGSLYVVDVHTEAFSNDGTKKRQIDLFKSELDRIGDADALVVGGGDLNTLPPGTDKRSDFEDVVQTDEDFLGADFRDEVDWLDALYRDYQPAIRLDDYRTDNASYCTHSSTGEVFWCRKLDYLFTNGRFVHRQSMTHQDVASGGVETMPLSDHAPVSSVLRLE